MSDSSDTDSNVDYTKIIYDNLYIMTLLLNRLKLIYRQQKKGCFSLHNENKIVIINVIIDPYHRFGNLLSANIFLHHFFFSRETRDLFCVITT